MADTTPRTNTTSRTDTTPRTNASTYAAETSARTATMTSPPGLHELMSPEVNVQRIMHTGTIWFSAAIVAVALVASILLSSGWRPAVLTAGLAVVFWVGTSFVAISIGLIGWSGCPILEVDVPTASRNKSLTMQLGTMMFIVGGFATLIAVLLGPAA